MNEGNIFEVDFNGGRIRVQRLLVANQTIYRVAFSDKRNPLILTRATSDNAGYFWTSVPEGRQREADEVGAVIANYIKANQ